MKLTNEQKERNKRYTMKLRLIEKLNELNFGKLKETKCEKCTKTIKVQKMLDSRKQWLGAMNRNKKLGSSDSEFPFGVIQSGFQSSHPLIVCKDCRDAIFRFMGKIPDLHDYKVFPQRLSEAVEFSKFMEHLKSKKKTKFHILYGKRKFKDTPRTYNKLLKESVKRYIKKYPYIKFTEKQLIGILKNYKNQIRVSVF